jgi:hypothetical protein
LNARARALARLNRALLQAFSRRTSDALRAALPLRLALPHLEPLLARNVAKEVRKDAVIIERAGRASPQELLAEARRIDREFLAGVGRMPIRIVVPYAEIEPLRARRIALLGDAARRVLDAWPPEGRLRAALRACFTRAEFEALVREDLRLYALETRALSGAVSLPAILRPAREAIAQRLFAIMQAGASALARDAAASVFRAGRKAGATD